jgi:ATPase subunit of ABC transporter with duplicated ATPase domains
MEKKGIICFEPGMNALIGPNGHGKSTILRAIHACEDCRKKVAEDSQHTFRLFDAEALDPHAADERSVGLHDMLLKVRAKFSSHGESMKDALASFDFKPGDCLLFDEPERGQDFESVVKLRAFLDDACGQGCQVIAASHHPVFWDNAHVIELEDGYAEKVLRRLCAITCPPN